VNEVVEEMNGGGGGGGGGDTDKFQQESAWDDSVQDWVFHNKVALKQGKGSSTRLLDPSPRDSDPWRQSPYRKRERMEKNQSQKLEMKWQVQGGGGGGYSERNALDFMENDLYGKNESWGKDKKHNQQDQEYHNHTISSSMGSKEGRRREKLQSNNNNLLDESLSLEESSPRSAKKKNINVSTPGTEQTLESTPAAESNPSTSPLSSVLYGDGIKKEKQGLADVRMKLFQQQSAPLNLTQDTKVENGEERLQQGYKPSMSDAKSSPLSDTGPPHASNANQNESNEKRIEKQSQVTLMEENEFLRRQLVRYKKLLLENGKISKNEPCRSEASSTISSESGSSKTASTMFSQSEAIQIKAQMVNLKASLSKKEAEFDKLKEAYEQIDLSQKAQIQQLREKLKNYKSKAEYGVLEAQMSAMQKSVDLYKEQLEESEEYIKELEKTIDHQLQMWQEEEEAFRKEVDALREQSNGSAHYKEHCGTTKAEVEKLKEELQHAKKEIEELRSTKDTLDNSLRSTNMKRLAKESTERHEETVRILQEEKDELEHELRELKTNMENLRDQSMSVEFENKTEIKKLKEQLNHAAFRVQVMRNESPNRKRQDGSNTDSEESTVSRLMEQLKEADRKTEEAWASKKKVEESLVALKAMEEENAKKHRAEMDTLSKKLSEARSRSRRIAVKSEEELAKIRESEREFKRKANIYQEQATELRQCIAKLQHQYSDELSSRKRIESALRNEISLLRQDKVSKSSNSILPYSVNLNSNRVGNELKFLIDMCSTLQSSVEPISKAKQKIGKDMLDRVVNNVDELAAVVRKIEVAAEEDKLQIENAFSIYDSAVTSYEKQIESLQENIKMSKEELATCTQQRLESAKKAKQAEIDLQAKLNSLKVQLAKVQQEYHQYREKMELKSDPNVATDFSSKDDPNDMKVLSVGEVQTSVNEAVKHQSETAKASNRKMNVLTGISKGGIELNLREAEESMALSTTSNNNSDLISRWRSMDFSTNTDLCDTDKQEPGERSIHTSQSSPDDVLIISKSDASGLQTNDFCPEDEKCQITTDFASQYSDQASKSSQSISHEKNESSWQSGSTISDFSKLNDLSRDGAKEINGAQNDSSSTAQFREELADSTQDDGDTSVGSQSDDDNRCYDDTTQASV
jgi:predicted  nucleic acid-binding Zn-ribbon protein